MITDPSYKKTLTPNQARKRAEAFCAYQERSQQELRNKLYEWGLHKEDVELIISELISANFLNEERFSTAYALGKFRIKHWGKIKIRQALKLKGVPDKLIQKSLAKIDTDDYLSTLRNLVEKKAALSKESDRFKKKISLSRYAASKGYEQDLIYDVLGEIEGD